jgi:anti-sigma-K factor RskA
LLEGDDRSRFEATLARDAALRGLVDELRDASAELARTAPAVAPPPALKDRLFASLDGRAAPAVADPVPDNVIRPAVFQRRQLAPWAAAACFAVLAAWLGQRAFVSRSELAAARDRQALAEIALQSARQQLEAERIVLQRQAQDLEQKLAGTAGELSTLRTRLDERTAQVATLTGRLDAMTGASAEVARQLEQAKDRIARLSADIVAQRDLADFKITTLASMLQNSPQALAVAVWDPAKQEGVLKVEKLPALLPSQDYQLWVVDPQYPNPVDGGVFTVDEKTGEARVTFKANQPVKAISAFAVTLERKGGVPKAEGPFVLLGK